MRLSISFTLGASLIFHTFYSNCEFFIIWNIKPFACVKMPFFAPLYNCLFRGFQICADYFSRFMRINEEAKDLVC